MQVVEHSLQKRIDKIFDHLYAQSNVKNPEIIALEFSKILHTGIFIEREKGIIPAFKEFLPLGNEGIFKDINNEENLVKEFNNAFIEMNNSWSLFDEFDKINFSVSDIYFICCTLFDLQLTGKNIDILGDSLEIFRNYSIKSLGGQFFTDPNVTKLALDIIDFNPLRGEHFIDICSGTGGFLLAAINRIKSILENENIYNEGHLANLSIKSIHGIEIDKTISDAANRNIQTRLGIKDTYVDNNDSLSLEASYNNCYDCIATNPPFGTKTTIKDYKTLNNFELSKLNKRLSPTSPDILFLEKNINLIKPETGRLAIVLPYQILSGPKDLYLRKWILQRCKIIAVIDLPPETFQPHTGTKTSLLVIKKRKQPDLELKDNNYRIFMSKPNWIGHDRRGNTIYKKNIDGSQSTEILCDFSIVYNDWSKFISEKQMKSDISFTIKAKDILNDEQLRFNALYYSISKDETISSNNILLKDIVDKIFYPGRFKRQYVNDSNNGVPFLGGSNITEHILSTKKYLSKNNPHLSQLIVREGWILITRSGTTGIVSMVPKEWDGFAISEHVIRIIPNNEKENPYFLFAFLQTYSAKQQISKGVFGSVIDEISPEAIGDIKIPIGIDLKIKNDIINSIKKHEETRNLSIIAHRQAMALINNII
jgi:type I restriction-modification system DNA methylase subunit